MKTLWTVVVAIGLLVVIASPAHALVVHCGAVSGPTELTGATILCPQFNCRHLGEDISIVISRRDHRLDHLDDIPHTGQFSGQNVPGRLN